MLQVNISEAMTDMSRLIEPIGFGSEGSITARYGKPAVKISTYDVPVSNCIGIAKGKFEAPADIDQDNSQIEKLF